MPQGLSLRLQAKYSQRDRAAALPMSDLEEPSSGGEDEAEDVTADDEHCHLCGQKYGELDRDLWHQNTLERLSHPLLQGLSRRWRDIGHEDQEPQS